MTRREFGGLAGSLAAGAQARQAPATAPPGSTAAPRIAEIEGRKLLLVEGRPFLILGLQWDCDTPFAREFQDPLFAHAARLGCNTAVLPLYWREVEPVEGRFDFTELDHRIDLARANGLRLVPVWFATFKNGCLNYAPDFVKSDRKRFRRARTSSGQELRNFSCPTSSETLAADRRAVEAIFTHLKARDSARKTVILFQVENESGIMGTDRCYCPECTREFERGGWASREQGRAAEAFTAQSVARYIEQVALTARSIYPLPLYVNAWLGSRDGIPGKDYPSGGPVERVLDIWTPEIPHIELVAPDIYSHQLAAFRSVCAGYSGHGWPLYVSEHSCGKDSRAERNVFYALGEHQAIGFSPWAIDTPFPDVDGRPLVHRLDGRWSEEAYDLRDSFLPLRDAMEPVARAQGTGRLKFFVQEEGAVETRLDFDGVTAHVRYRHEKRSARGMVVRMDRDVFVVLGTGFEVRFLTPSGQGIPLTSVDRGRFEGAVWRTLLPVRREREDRSLPFRVAEGSVVRVGLELT